MYAIEEKRKRQCRCVLPAEERMKKPFREPSFGIIVQRTRNKPRGYSPTQIICVSFVIVIALGTLLLFRLPIAARYGRMRVIDAMFAAMCPPPA